MKIIVDTREQRPFFKRGVVRRTLNVGDYSTLTLEKCFAIERKSLQDLYRTLIHNHPRFRRQIIRAIDRGITMVMVVEGTYKDFVNKNFPRGSDRKCKPETLKKIISTVKRRYAIEIIFCKNVIKAKQFTLNRLKYEERKLARTTRKRIISKKDKA